MTRFLLDTGLLSGWLLARPGAIGLIQPWITNGEAATSMLAYGEVVEYIVRRPDGVALKTALHLFLNDVEPLALDVQIMDRYADLRLRMRPPRGPGLIGDVDTLIAATAIERNLTVVTTDGDLGRVPGLNVLLVARKSYLPLGV